MVFQVWPGLKDLWSSISIIWDLKGKFFLNFDVTQNEVVSVFSSGGMKPHSRKGRKRYLAKFLFSLFRVILIGIDPFLVKSSLFYLFIWFILSLIQQTLFFHYSLFPSLNTLRQDTAILICPPKLMLLILLLNVSRRLDTSSIPLFLDRVSRVQLNNPNYTQSSLPIFHP